jgi:dsRNA-specific ribonuclease
MGDEEWKKRLNDPGYKNWIKVSLALIESKEALHVFTERTIVELHKAIQTSVHSLGVGTCTKTPLCNTNKGKAPSCASCTEWVKEIKKQSRGQLLWKNADPSTWHNVHWEIAKCFMNAQGSKATAASVTGPDKTDLSGMLNVLVNCKEFENHLDKKKLPESVRTVRNKLMHCATMSLSDTEMQDMVEQVIALLEDNKELKHEKISQDKVKIIKSLRDNEFELKSKDEEVCIGTALETYALAADRGEEIDENMMSLHEKLIKLIEGNKDLEKKFDDKLKNIDEKVTNMKQEYDAEFSIMRDVIIGDLKGRIESLEKNQASGQSFPSNSASSVIRNEIKSFYKNALQSYAQRKKLDLPKYETNKIEGKGFVSTISFEGNEFKSNAPKPSKKEAEQNAAEQALQFIGNEDLEVSNEKNDSPSAEHQVIDNKSTSQQKDKNCKNLLQEIAQKKKIPNPIYNSTQAESGFSSEVMFDGQWYHPDISPQKKKVDAEQKAARFVLACLDR